MTLARRGNKAKIHLTGRTTDGVVFQTTEGADPITVEVGGEELVAGLRNAIVGMTEGEERTVVVPPEKGYGPVRPRATRKVPLEMMPEGAREGDKLYARVDKGTVEVWVKEIGKKTAVIDENHPLAGETLGFDLKLVSIEA